MVEISLPLAVPPTCTCSLMPRLPSDPALLVAQQRREKAPLADADVIPLLKDCLEAEAKPHITSFLCGELKWY